MFLILRYLGILLINIYCLLPLDFLEAQSQEQKQIVLRCFDEKNPPPTIAGGFNVIVNTSDTTTVNLHPDKKMWGQALDVGDFEKRVRLPKDILEIDLDIRVWTSSFWEGWLQVACSVEPFDKKEVSVTVLCYGFSSSTWFLREQSGRIVDAMDVNILQHEQGHFDIVELGRRRWQRRAEIAEQELIELAADKQCKLSLVDSAPRDQDTISKKAREMIAQLANQKHFVKTLSRLARFKLLDSGWVEGLTELYDHQTKYGAHRRAQKQWMDAIVEMFEDE